MPYTLRGLLVRSAAVGTVCGAAAVLAGAGWAGPAADPPKTEKKAADAAKADDKKPAFDPKDVRIGPPPELAALRAAVEEAARKGENVDEIRKQLESLEKALAGKAWVKPRVVEEPAAPPAFPGGGQLFPPRGQPFPVQPAVPFPGAFQLNPVDLELLQKAQELMQKAAQLALADPAANKEKVEALRREAQELMQKAMRQAGGGLMVPFPGFGGGPAVRGGNARLGVRVEKVPAAVADRGGVPEGRGVLVAEVLPGTAAEKVGLKADDVIIEFAGQPVSDDPTEFVRTVRAAKRGQKVDIVYVRKGKKAEAKGVSLADPAADLGADLAPLLGPEFQLVPDLNALPLRERGLAPAGAGKRSTVSVRVEDGMFKIDADQDGLKLNLEGTADGGKPVPSKIVVVDGKKKVEAKSVDELPAEYRDVVKKVLAGVRVGK